MTPFDAIYDPGILKTMEVAAAAQLPWFDNGILSPDVRPENWVYHFKEEEWAVVQQRAKELGGGDIRGYVCERDEANMFGLRALAQEFAKSHTGLLPIIIASTDAHASVAAAAEILDLAYAQIEVDTQGSMAPNALAKRLQTDPQLQANAPVILVATLGSEQGGFDALSALLPLLRSGQRPVLTHVDASRSFDFLARDDRGQILNLTLSADTSAPTQVQSIAAGGLAMEEPQFVTALTLTGMGERGANVAYVRGPDETISGSRPAISTLGAYLLQARFGNAGKQAILARAELMADYLEQVCQHCQLGFMRNPGSLDVRLTGASLTRLPQLTLAKLGIRQHQDVWVLTLQPSVKAAELAALARALADVTQMTLPAALTMPKFTRFPFSKWQVDETTASQLADKVQGWRNQYPASAGYPGNQATLSVLSGLLRPFLSLHLPRERVEQMSAAVVATRLQALGVEPADKRYAGTLTTGSTMGNRIGLMNALRWHRGQPVRIYMSDATHYSGSKICSDHAGLRHKWQQVASEPDGAMSPKAFAEQIRRDLREYGPLCFVLVANQETTFAGGCDDLPALFAAAQSAGAQVNFVHLDGALGLGASFENVRLAEPGELPRSEGGLVYVNGITVSNHKFPGLRVSGVCFGALAPGETSLASAPSMPNATAALHLWAYDQLITPQAAYAMRQACEQTTAFLRAELKKQGFRAEGATHSIITVVDQPPNPLGNVFMLAPQGDKAHFIAMQHIDRDDAKHFVQTLQQTRAATLATLERLDANLAPLQLRGALLLGKLPSHVLENDDSGACDTPMLERVIDFLFPKNLPNAQELGEEFKKDIEDGTILATVALKKDVVVGAVAAIYSQEGWEIASKRGGINVLQSIDPVEPIELQRREISMGITMNFLEIELLLLTGLINRAIGEPLNEAVR